MEKKERSANLHASALRRELDRCLATAPPTCARTHAPFCAVRTGRVTELSLYGAAARRMSEQTQRAEAFAGRAQLAMTARNWAEAISLYENALREVTEHPATLSPTASSEPSADAAAGTATATKPSGASDGCWYRVAMPALLRAGPSLSSRALERLEVGGVVQAQLPEIEYEGRRRLQVAGNVYGRGWCSLETADGQVILRQVPSAANASQPSP